MQKCVGTAGLKHCFGPSKFPVSESSNRASEKNRTLLKMQGAAISHPTLREHKAHLTLGLDLMSKTGHNHESQAMEMQLYLHIAEEIGK